MEDEGAKNKNEALKQSNQIRLNVQNATQSRDAATNEAKTNSAMRKSRLRIIAEDPYDSMHSYSIFSNSNTSSNQDLNNKNV